MLTRQFSAFGNTQSMIFRFEPRTERQREAFELFKEVPLMFLLGPAGSGKTTVALACALQAVMQKGSSYKKIISVRPTIEMKGMSLGYLPGELKEKLLPYQAPMAQALARLTFHPDPELLTHEALAYVRGVTWDECVVLVDEAQNLSYFQLKTVLTRLGKTAKMIVLGDTEQSDIEPRNPSYACDLEEVVELVEDNDQWFPDVAIMDFDIEDIQRHSLVGRLLRHL